AYARPLLCFHDTAPSEIYTLSLHDALPICLNCSNSVGCARFHRMVSAWKSGCSVGQVSLARPSGTPIAWIRLHRLSNMPTMSGSDRKSTRLNSSHVKISYAVFCLKKKKTKT